MKQLFTATTIYATVFALLVSLVIQPVADAATTPQSGGQALEIAPPVVNLLLDPGQTSTTQISLRNISNGKLAIAGSVEDFIAAGEDGTPKLLLDPGETSPFSMKTWFKPLTKPTLNARQIQNFPVTITVPRNAAPGGYFAVVRFTATAPEIDSTGVALSASLGSLILVRVKGAAKEGMQVESFIATTRGDNTPETIFESAPITFVQRLKNTGNVHEQPVGQITIKSMFGKPIATVNVNLPPRNILPQSIRRFEQPLDKSVLGNTMLFGRYTATLKLKYGTNGQTLTDSITFWVIPYKLIAFAILGLIAAFFVLRTMIRRYNQSIISRAQKKPSKRK